MGQGPCPGPASSSSPSGWPAARASLLRAPHTEVTFSDMHASPSRWCVVFAACSRSRRRGRKRRALVGAPSARSLARAMKRAGRGCFVGLVRSAPEASRGWWSVPLPLCPRCRGPPWARATACARPELRTLFSEAFRAGPRRSSPEVLARSGPCQCKPLPKGPERGE